MRSVTIKANYLASLILVAILVTSVFTAIFVGAQGETTITEDSFQSNYNYLIFQDGSTYYAQNGETGEISFSDSNITALREDVIDTLPNGDGYVFDSIIDYFCYYNNSNVAFAFDGANNEIFIAYDADLIMHQISVGNWDGDARFLDITPTANNTLAVVRILPKGEPAGNTVKASIQIFATDIEADPNNYEAMEFTHEVISGTPRFHINVWANGTGTARPLDIYLNGALHSTFTIAGDIQVWNWGRGILLTNSDGNATKRITLNPAGDGLLITDP